MNPILETPVVLVEPHHLIRTPSKVFFVASFENVIDRQIGTSLNWTSHRRVAPRETQIFQFLGGDPAFPREKLRADHATSVEMVTFIPAVVFDFVALFGVDHREQHGTDSDGVIVHSYSQVVVVPLRVPGTSYQIQSDRSIRPSTLVWKLPRSQR